MRARENHYERCMLEWGNTELDKIDKVLLILPVMPLVDIVSTLFSLRFGGQEIGIIAKPIYERYGEPGLIALSSFSFVVFSICVWILRIQKTKFIQGQLSKQERRRLAVAVNIFFAAEAWWTGVVIQNLLVPLSLSLFGVIAIWSGVAFVYFVLISFFTQVEMRRLIRG